ncbi:MAG: hypothetical protein PHH13_01980 [Candidatus Peribacteraceae bacterium]|nr:hypothetical protein [Candidatus Peribacteraceae bacterium]
MTIRKLERSDTDFMRDYIQEGVDRGETEKQIAARRRELAKLFGCTLPQVVGAVAWKRHEEEEKLTLEPLELPTPDAADTVTPTASAAEQKGESVQDQHSPNVDLGGVQLAEQEHRVPLSANDQWKDAPDSTRTIRVHPKSGAWTDYEHSQVKEQWRAVEMDFLDRHLDTLGKKPEELKVLCTPGIKCYLEVQHLLRRGIRPENILAVEREDGAWNEFEQNCVACGIRPRYGDLRNVLPNINTKFDVVLLDFLGQYCLAHQEVIYQLPIADKAMIALNMGGKRERKAVQDAMNGVQESAAHLFTDTAEQRMAELYREAEATESRLMLNPAQRHSRFTRIWGQALRESSAAIKQRDIVVNDEVRGALMHTLLHEVGIARPDNWSLPNMIGKLPLLFGPDEVRKAFKRDLDPNFIRTKSLHKSLERLEFGILGQFRMAACGLHPELRSMWDTIAPLIDMAGCAATGGKKIVALERYKYLSRVGETPSPYLTDLAVIELPRARYKEQQQSTHFALACAREVTRDAISKRSRKFPIALGGHLKVTVLEGNRQFHVASIPLDTLLKDMTLYQTMETDFPLSRHGYTGADIERRTIE